ncbi:SMP-30/gluconolactonase/LRE family protein [Agromyces allii]|uniref:SMP-30/gluconolactonase/LRE family protein n=1 Tax=Agromyces allii TaxID=393607 RepID=A0ABP5BPC6_9MICO|nr:SMP-30/gluconolactonase/LRE family protein [Agromyces allii]
MTEFHAVPASPDTHVLAEGPVWIAETSTVLWIDVELGIVFEGRLDGDGIRPTRQVRFDGRVGAAVPAVDGGLLVAAHDRFVFVTADGERLDGPIIVAPGIDSRSNDGACDPDGRFVVGTLALDDRGGGERLLRLEHDGALTTLDADLDLSNGIAWSPDGTLMYSTDTMPGIVWVRDYDAATGGVGPRRRHLHVEDGYPDGICVDVRGHLWVAIWGGGEVRSFTPDGVPADTVRVAAPHVSSVAFVGDDLDRLLITTASRDLDDGERRRYPDAGRLFLAEVATRGVPTTSWATSALTVFSATETGRA